MIFSDISVPKKVLHQLSFYTMTSRQVALGLGLGASSRVRTIFDLLLIIMSMWRPVTKEGMRVAPSDLAQYCVSHQFRAPCCLCACIVIGSRYTESAIYLASAGQYSGEFVAGCASGSCGYLSMTASPSDAFGRALLMLTSAVGLECMYPRRGLLLHRPLVRRMLFHITSLHLKTNCSKLICSGWSPCSVASSLLTTSQHVG